LILGLPIGYLGRLELYDAGTRHKVIMPCRARPYR